jgi:hypothetical protein
LVVGEWRLFGEIVLVMKILFKYSSLALMFFISCKEIPLEKTKSVLAEQMQDQDIKLAKEVLLIESLLNDEKVKRFSKFRKVKNNFDAVYVYYEHIERLQSKITIYQEELPLVFIAELNDLDPKRTPCYYFEEFQVKNNEASVKIFFELTNCIVSGRLKFEEGKWIPEKDFVVGVI